MKRGGGGGTRTVDIGQIYKQQENLDGMFVSSHSLLDKVEVVEYIREVLLLF